ncbi:MAG TPA: HEPN domain-containing protein [Nitrospiria bacterium]|nr:HEPN domain-containing protein [Nitrospiria bacterium]
MSEREDSPYSEDWLRVARQDWHRIHVMLADGDGDAAGLFLQQAIEKFLKAFLLEHGWKLKKVHTLQSLLDEAVAFKSTLAPFRPLCEKVSGFYFAERYPSLGGEELDAEDVRRELDHARGLILALFPREVPE